MSTSTFNRRWAAVILEALSRHGVRHLCIAPGSRSTPLTLAAAQNPAFTLHTHFDERGLGHLALGLAKASGEPVAVIVTSGTAVANLYPAVIEAGLTGEKLVAITADRPPELIDCGANQAIRQQAIFASHPAAALDLPRPTPSVPAAWLISAIDEKMGALSAGALHINCPFAEPLYGELDDTGLEWQQAPGEWWQEATPWLRLADERAVNAQPDWSFWRAQRGVVLAGRLSAQEGAAVAQWAQRLGWPLIGDVLSQTGQPLPCADLWLAHPDAARVLEQAQLVVQFGGSLTGKRVLQWQSECRPQEYWIVDALPGRLDPAHHRGRRLVADISAWLAQHTATPSIPWAEALEGLAARTQRIVARELTEWGEAQVAHRLPELLAPDGQLFLGNSLTVRLADALAQLPAGYPVYGNRGASGIDGLISTAAGVQRATGRPTLAVLGDLSTLYDINALALLRDTPAPFVLMVVNNNGGQIFSMLPTPAREREKYYCMPQNVRFAPAAALFSLRYEAPESLAALREAMTRAWQSSVATVIELRVPQTDGAQAFQRLIQQVRA
ncbi:2-succinyl-5-enolpyruvyl-6-hydroxy-3-cyclohexene-1-carboxylic-acid synthase [Cronobacter dublinensis]|uniref:2-succinyl-5-enolpyruvyl-6-hydroxy-3- cyclohexene-1-carboxylic-acid synthase n=1 Tax=Cronobacter dublinensis TaxID=413497 RepID=UPI0024C2A97E|nr:2-succinyl-5-enolpyruvyl-6-hydroxy-3-cyclohexene-1-carboxylic-acid synthase [Cronobacter dublinensis]ELY6211521.1 2-succinyl-5-enolpyruvyl-6-hydroxy-3-cyclohexene-1-carboxylic-acid synthase [Cronobacter dublinensis]EMD9246903.1 2-succinyl-5-enolpyruvyl-6-hydroxy-3-cyclohexene-1-carboxylic-acid synthase [Cronobacter dublinensis]MDK1198344.1 2-succinyl-5-enolpyruvyl-6-hydroxy-3-cyclohexene-1-carboxylic-acid synthase [Cronobacter dublinensis]